MSEQELSSIKKVAIIGGGTAGWMTAAALSTLLGRNGLDICLVESEQIGTVGVGEATLPHLRFFNQRLGIDEPQFMRDVNATYKLGIEFINWGQIGDAYIHPFGDFGQAKNGIEFHHYWMKSRQHGNQNPIGTYSLPVVAAQHAKFDFPSAELDSLLSTYSYAYHIDAGLYAAYLRKHSEARGVVRHEGLVSGHKIDPETGFVNSIQLQDGLEIQADLFIDCSGFRGLLIEQALETGYEHWKQWLPCDRAVAIPCAANDANIPYTKATADDAGWRWRIPLQHRVGNGHVYSSDFMDDDTAERKLRQNLEGEPERDANFLRFNTGRRKLMWNRNVVAIGLSAGFLEPLESTGIHLIQLGIMKLIEFFPNKQITAAYRDEFNRMMQMEIERIKDFLILHYHATQRDDTDFWNHVRTMSLPDELQRKMSLFKHTGKVVRYQEGLFLEPSWVAVYFGQRFLPDAYDSRLKHLNADDLQTQLDRLQAEIEGSVQNMPDHLAAIERVGTPGNDGWKNVSMSLYGH